MINFHVVSIFPELVKSYCEESILKKGKEKGLVNFFFYNLRDFANNKHQKVDDRPYGGGPGMVLQAEPVLLCVESIKKKIKKQKKIKIVLFAPNAPKWTNDKAQGYLQKYTDIILICGRYEGVDRRVEKILRPAKISVGDYVLTGGEIPAMILIDTISRQVPGVLGNLNSLEDKRVDVLGNAITTKIDECYTRPEVLLWQNKKYKVPKVFLSGNPKLIDEYRKKTKSPTLLTKIKE